MPTLTPTRATGATAKPSQLLYVEPECAVTDDDLEAQIMPGSGLNAPFLADLLSGMLAHERCGRHLYRSVEGRTHNPMLKRKYVEFGAETERHAEILERLITMSGGNPNYVSPTARAVQGMDTKLIESTFAGQGALDIMTAEMAMLDAVFVAESMDHGNWSMLSKLYGQLPDGELRDAFSEAVDEVGAQEDGHLEWARTTKERLVMLQAKSSVMSTAAAKTEEMIARVASWLDGE